MFWELPGSEQYANRSIVRFWLPEASQCHTKDGQRVELQGSTVCAG